MIAGSKAIPVLMCIMHARSRDVDGIKDDRGTKGPGSQTATIALRSVKSRPIYELSRRAGLFAAHK